MVSHDIASIRGIPNNRAGKRTAMSVTPHNRKAGSAKRKKLAAHRYTRRLMRRDLTHTVETWET